MDESSSHTTQGNGGARQGQHQGQGYGERSAEPNKDEQTRSFAGSLTEQARSVASGAGSTATDLARRAREGAAAASGAVYEQGSQAGQYLARGIDEYPITALLVAGAVGYGLAYLIHSRWEIDSPKNRRSDRERRDQTGDNRNK